MAVAAANTDVSFAATSRFVWTAISCALIRAIAANALDFRVGVLLEPSREPEWALFVVQLQQGCAGVAAVSGVGKGESPGQKWQ